MDNRANSTGTPTTALTKRPARVCRFCNIGQLRRSRMRPADLPWLLVLRWPVRCLRCSKRQYLLWPMAMQALSSHTPHAPELLTKQSWQNYTGAVAAKPGVAAEVSPVIPTALAPAEDDPS
jgi:hypothetical protein